MGVKSSGPVRLLKTASFRKLFMGQAVSGLGDWVATFGFIALAYDLTHNTNYVAWILIIRLVPPLLAAPFGGILADRLPRRPLMISLDIARAGLIALVPFLNIWLIFAVAFVHEFLALFYYPARDSALPDLVPKKMLAAANGLILASSYGTLPIAGAIFSAVRNSSSLVPAWFPFHHIINQRPAALVFFLDSLTFLFSAAMVYRMSIPHRGAAKKNGLRDEFMEGVRYIWDNRPVRLLALGILMAMFGGGVLFAVGIAYVRETLNGSDSTFGWLASLWGAGMALGLLLVRKLISWRGGAYVFVASVAFCGALLISMALVSKVFLAFAFAVPFGMAFALAITLAMSLAQTWSDEAVRGRTLGGLQLLYRGGLAAGALIMGAVAHEVHGARLIIPLDSNQLSMIISGLLIIVSAGVSSRMLRLPKKKLSA
ncbi:MAG TPA: MFS transporter [Candidatus Saccharimonadales bacterium]|nr:MFS transporter [Candidatus Saccharimonadales bacterium]